MQGYTPGFQPKERDFIKLNTNENPYPPSPKAVEAMKQACGDSLRKYPQPLADKFREAAAGICGVKPEQIICGFGSDDLLTIAVRTFCDQGGKIAFPYPSYSLYEILADIQGAEPIVVHFPQDFSLPDNLHNTGADLTLLANPNAPSGTLIPPKDIAELADAIDGVLLVDEAYGEFASDNCIKLVGKCDNIIVTRTFSKAYSLAGLRFGYAIADACLVEQMMKVKDSYNVSAPGIAGAAAAIEDQDWLHKNVGKIKADRTALTEGLNSLGFTCPDSETNFVLAQVPDNYDAEYLYQQLFENKILVRYFKMPRLEQCLRITVGTKSEVSALLNTLGKIMKGA